MNNKIEIIQNVVNSINEFSDFVGEYNDKPHIYGKEVLYKVECHTLQYIGRNKDANVSGIALSTKRTKGAVSKIVAKLCKRGLVQKTVNTYSKRVVNLSLTEAGRKVYLWHEQLDNRVNKTFEQILSSYTAQQLVSFNEMFKSYLSMEKVLNEIHCEIDL